MIICFVTFLVQQSADQFFGGDLLGWLGLIPSSVVIGHRFWQLVTYSFLHGDVMHLFLNLMMLAFIGGELEALWGTVRFLKFYFFCAVSAALFYLVLQLFISRGAGLNTPMVGASGAIYGLLAAYGVVFGERVLLFMMLFPMKAKHFIWVLAGIEFMSTVFSGRGGLASIAHVGGMAAGLSYLWGRAAWIVWSKRRAATQALSGREKRKKAGDHLRLVIDNEKSDPDDKPKIWH
jgi:membrane associated rhomboid family serine protease